MRLSEKYRPTKFEEVLGQDQSINKIRSIMKKYSGGLAFWLSGNSGTGKTTIARIIAQTVADKMDIVETVGNELSKIKLIEIRERWRYYSTGKKHGHALIVDEAQGIKKPVVEILMSILENLADNVVVIFTTTHEGKQLFDEKFNSAPFASRCIKIQLKQRDLCEPFAKLAKLIAEIEGQGNKPLSEYIKLVKKCHNNMRTVLQEIECGAMMK